MIINPEVLKQLYVNADASFKGAYEKTPVWKDMVASTISSSTKTNLYAWAKQIPTLRKFVGERQINNLEGRGYELTNEKYELTIGVSRDDLEDDNLGIYKPQFETMGMQAAKWPDYLLADLLMSGTSHIVFDGQGLFSASHPVDMSDASKGTYSNLLTSKPLTPTNYAEARATMRAYKGEDGRAMGVTPSVLVVPPQLEHTALTLMNSEIIAATNGVSAATGSSTNVLRNSAQVLVMNELAAQPANWYLLDASKPIKPLIFQSRRAPEFVSMTDPANPEVWKNEQFYYSVTARGAVGASLPFLILRAEG